MLSGKKVNVAVVSRSFSKKHEERLVSSWEWRESRTQKKSIVLHEEQLSSQHEPLAKLLLGLE